MSGVISTKQEIINAIPLQGKLFQLVQILPDHFTANWDDEVKPCSEDNSERPVEMHAYSD